MLLKGQELFSTDSKLGEAWTVGKLDMALLYNMQSMYMVGCDEPYWIIR